MEAIHMKTDVRMISLALAATALISGELLAAPARMTPSDAQAQAATLLSREWTPVARDVHIASTVAPRADGHTRAAALLTGKQTEGDPALSQAASMDGQARAAALLSRGTP
jgi:hypothetical protein